MTDNTKDMEKDILLLCLHKSEETYNKLSYSVQTFKWGHKTPQISFGFYLVHKKTIHILIGVKVGQNNDIQP